METVLLLKLSESPQSLDPFLNPSRFFYSPFELQRVGPGVFALGCLDQNPVGGHPCRTSGSTGQLPVMLPDASCWIGGDPDIASSGQGVLEDVDLEHGII